MDQIYPAIARCAATALIQINAAAGAAGYQARVWQPISNAPFDRDLELAVLDREGPHALVFACRRILSGWINAETKQRIDVRPTHWRDWGEKE
jgi:hypothetical protein